MLTSFPLLLIRITILEKEEMKFKELGRKTLPNSPSLDTDERAQGA